MNLVRGTGGAMMIGMEKENAFTEMIHKGMRGLKIRGKRMMNTRMISIGMTSIKMTSIEKRKI
jgi:hypothetical protein